MRQFSETSCDRHHPRRAGERKRRKGAMSGPGGAYTKRDQRRESRKEQFQRRQVERQRERERQLRNQRIRQWSIYGGVALAVILLGALIFSVIRNNNSPSTSGGLQPANGQAVD